MRPGREHDTVCHRETQARPSLLFALNVSNASYHTRYQELEEH